jgi:iron(III) transport system ATP-binding protein
LTLFPYTTLFRSEAFALADQIGVMSEGTLLQWATPSNLLEQPINDLVADILRRDTLAEKRAAARLRGKPSGSIITH